MSKTLQDFFGNAASIGDFGDIQFTPFAIIQELERITGRSWSSDTTNPNQVVCILLYYWFLTNYKDETTGVRLSQDKTIPIVSSVETPRTSLTTRQEENQFKHSLSFDVYTEANSSFNPSGIVSGN